MMVRTIACVVVQRATGADNVFWLGALPIKNNLHREHGDEGEDHTCSVDVEFTTDTV